MTKVKKINEKNVAKFVEKLNEVCHERFEMVDPDFYGIHEFRNHTRKDGTIIIYDEIGTYRHDCPQTEVNKIIEEMAEKNGWCVESVSGDFDFCFAER